MPNECNIPSRTIFTGDNLDILRSVNSECVDLIYLDPPFNSNQTYAAPLDGEAKCAEFDDVWTLDDMKEEWIDEIELRMPSLFHLINGAIQGRLGRRWQPAAAMPHLQRRQRQPQHGVPADAVAPAGYIGVRVSRLDGSPNGGFAG